jgi:hypothetical protein
MYVTDKGKRISMGSSTFRVKDVPDPKAKVPGIPLQTTNVSRSELRKAGEIQAYMGDEFLLSKNKVAFGILSYRVQYTTANGTVNKQVSKRAFNDVVKFGIDNVADGGTITFTDIKARRKGYESASYSCPSLIFILK